MSLLDGLFNKKTHVCPNCTKGNCEQCDDVWAVVLGQELRCHCNVPGHLGEPMMKQIFDHETGKVWAPKITIDQDGKIERIVTDKDKEVEP